VAGQVGHIVEVSAGDGSGNDAGQGDPLQPTVLAVAAGNCFLRLAVGRPNR
jgi:hypothetical protein